MVSKNKILKGIDSHLTNFYCWKVDLELDENVPLSIKQSALNKVVQQYSELLQIRERLKELLVE